MLEENNLVRPNAQELYYDLVVEISRRYDRTIQAWKEEFERLFEEVGKGDL